MENYLRSNSHVRRILPVLLLLFLIPFSIQAKHIIGGEMTYRFVSTDGIKNTYEFTLVVFRDCDSGGGQLDQTARIGIYKGSFNNAVFFDKKDAPISPIQNVPPVVPPCADASQVNNACVQRGTYVFTLSLPIDSLDSYFVVYQRCCRTEQITNITTPDQYGATYMAEVTPLAQALQSSSPTFNNYPPTFICNNFDLNFDHSATDIDGDSLVYFFCTPFTGGGSGGGGNGCNSPTPNPACGPPFNYINFAGVYTQQSPMGGNPTVSVDSLTGQLYGTPSTLGQFVVGICVQEYRNGQLIGSILRDFQFNVVDCNPTVVAAVQADMVTGPQEFLVKRCGPKVVTVLNGSPQTPDLVSWQWEFDLGNGNTYISGAWNATFILPDYGTYTGRLYLNRNLSCEDTAFITLHAYPGSDAGFAFDWDICSESPVVFADTSKTGSSGGIIERYWVFNTLSDTLYEANPEVLFPSHGNYPVKLVIIDADGCRDTMQQSVDWNPQPPPEIPQLNVQRICLPDVAVFNELSSMDLTGSTVTWDFGDGTRSTELNPQHTYEDPGQYDVNVRIQTPFDCISTDTFLSIVFANNRPVPGFEYAPAAISTLENRVKFTNTSSSDAAGFQWQFGNEGSSPNPEPIYTFQDTGLINVTLTVTNLYGCIDSVAQVLDIVPKLRIYIPNIFSPSSDTGLGNDHFGILGIIPGYQEYQISIWSRWGEMVFQSEDASEGWNGRKGNVGRPSESGVYIYQIELTGPRGEKYHWEGTVTLM